MLKRMTVWFVFFMLAIMLASCSGESESSTSSAPDDGKPVTLSFFTSINGNYANTENFEREIGSHIKEKYPNVTINHIPKGKQYEELFAENIVPDLILESPTHFQGKIKAFDLEYDLGSMIEKYDFNLERIDQNVLQFIQNANSDGKVYGLPFSLSTFALFYNKDIFDSFGVSYPKDGMNWNEVYELAKQLTRTADGTNYGGFVAHAGLMLKYNQLSLSWLHPTENIADVNTDGWKKVFDNHFRFYEIPGNEYIPVDDFPKGTTAMAVHVAEKVVAWPQANPDIRWDIVSVPEMNDRPGVGMQPNSYFLFVSKHTEHKEQAFQIVQHLLSDEVQKKLSRQGVVTPLVSEEVRKLFGSELPTLEGKNAQAVFYNDFAPPPPKRGEGLIYAELSGMLSNGFADMLETGEDVNTVLLRVEEEMNQALSELIENQK